MLLFKVRAVASAELRLLGFAAPYGSVSVGQGVNAVVLDIPLVVERAEAYF